MSIKKKTLIIASLLALGSIGLAKSIRMLDWIFRAPSVSNPNAVDPKTAGDILFDTSTSTFKGWNGASWTSFSSSSAGNLSVRSVTTTDTATTSDDVLLLSGASFSETLFDAVGNAGKVIEIVHDGTSLTNVYTLFTTGSETIGGVASGSYALYTNGESLKLMSDGSNWVILKHETATALSQPVAIGISATSTNPSKGTTTIDSYRWRRDGQYAVLEYSFDQSTGGSAGSGDYLLDTGNITVDTAVVPAYTTSGILLINHSAMESRLDSSGDMSAGTGTSDFTSAVAFLYSSTKIRISGVNGLGSLANWSSSTFPIADSNLGFSFTVKVPVVGWEP